MSTDVSSQNIVTLLEDCLLFFLFGEESLYFSPKVGRSWNVESEDLDSGPCFAIC